HSPPPPRAAPPPPGSGDGGAARTRAGRSALVATERATLPVEAPAAVIAPERPVPVPARALAAARPAIEADAQLAAADLRPRDPLHLLRGQRAADLDQGEVREDLDLADVLAVQTALAGQGADDPRGPCTVGVAHPDLVRRVAALGGRCVAARAALPAPVVTGELRTGEFLLLGGGTGTVVTHRHRTEGGGQLQRIQVVLGDELTDQLAVEVQASALDALGQLRQLRGQTVPGHVARRGDDRLGERLLGGAFDVLQRPALVGADERQRLAGTPGSAGAPDAVHVGLRLL